MEGKRRGWGKGKKREMKGRRESDRREGGRMREGGRK
jgi:hypothetical protein